MSTQSFAALRRSRKDSLSKLTQALEKQSERGGAQQDTRFWTPTRDKAGNAFAEIRFLPAPPNEDLPWVRLFTHAFKGPGGRYIENSRTTLNEPDPVSEHNQKLWATGLPENQNLVRQRKRKLNYITNIYVVKDPANPENEGRVFLFKFGKKIWDKIQAALHPEPNTDEPINVFDFWDGANFKLKVRTVDKYPNYDMSQFTSPGPLLDDDEELEKIWKAQYSLTELVAPENFKSYDELKARFLKVIGEDGQSAAPRAPAERAARTTVAAAIDDEDDSMPPFDLDEEKPTRSKSGPPRSKIPAPAVEEDDDDDLAAFRGLINS